MRAYLIKNSVWLIPALMVVSAGFFAVLNVDSVRDYLMAYRIIDAGQWPLQGPQMAFTFHIGPYWYYLMTLPVLLFDSWLGMAVFVAVLNALKFFLAHRLGLLLLDKKLAHMLVLGLLITSFTQMQQVTFTHTNLVELAMLGMVYLTYRLSMQKHGHWLLLGLVSALAFHSHPTALFAGYFVFLRWLQLPKKPLHTGWFALGFLVVLSPMWINAFMQEATTAGSLADFVHHQGGHWAITDWFRIIYGVTMHAAWMTLQVLLPLNWAWLLMGLHVLLVLPALLTPLLWRGERRLQQLAVHGWIFLLISALALLLIRDRSPWYMTYGLSLSFAFLLALGWYRLSQQWRPVISHFITITVMATFILVNGLSMYQISHNTLRQASVALYDAKLLDSRISPRGYEITAHQAKAHGKFTCSLQPVALHGPYATLIHDHSGIEHLSQCGAQGLFYGPANINTHLIGVPNYFQNLIKQPPIHQIGSSFFHKPVAMAEQQKMIKEAFLHDYERRIHHNPNWHNQTKTSQLIGGDYLLITQQLGSKMQLQIDQVKLNSQPLQPLISNNFSTLYSCESCDANNSQWQINYRESVPGMTNIVTF